VKQEPVLITGGAGFIGSNLANNLLRNGQPVLIYDNLSRPGVEQNLRWLQMLHGGLVDLEIADVRDQKRLRNAIGRVSGVYHFAAQVAVTNSLTDPIGDFEINAQSTLYLLEALRALSAPPPLIYTSTNKVYGSLADIELRPGQSRYEPISTDVQKRGISEARPLDFHSPYGCSKGAADQYVLDYARSYGLPAAVFRMSCVYGPRQFGTEDQGWVAHFLIQAIKGSPITLYGNGKQVRDVLYVDDLVNALMLASWHIDQVEGEAFNIGGGMHNTVSLLELLTLIEELHGAAPKVQFDAWRTGDQAYYVSDTSKFESATGWRARVDLRDGVERLYNWLLETHRPRARYAFADVKGTAS
jgi:CDP-paratose 2-epimerase